MKSRDLPITRTRTFLTYVVVAEELVRANDWRGNQEPKNRGLGVGIHPITILEASRTQKL